MSRSEYASRANYSILANYNGTARNALGIGAVAPVNLGEKMIGVQAVPLFAGAFYGAQKNYDSLIHGPESSFGGYSTVNAAYIDCDADPQGKFCSMNGGKCVTYAMRSCANGEIMRGATGATGATGSA